jgi:hypothetical protein
LASVYGRAQAYEAALAERAAALRRRSPATRRRRPPVAAVTLATYVRQAVDMLAGQSRAWRRPRLPVPQAAAAVE